MSTPPEARIATKTSYDPDPFPGHPHEVQQLVPSYPGDFDYNPLAPRYPVPTMVWSKGSSYKTDYYRQRAKAVNPQPPTQNNEGDGRAA